MVERACPDQSVFTDSVCRMRMRNLGIGLRQINQIWVDTIISHPPGN